MNKVTLELTDEQLAKIQKMLADEPMSTGVRWRAEKDKRYWLIDDYGDIFGTVDMRLSSDNYRYDIGNYYKTEDEALVAEKKQLAMQKIFDYIAKGDAEKGLVIGRNNKSQTRYRVFYDSTQNALLLSYNRFIVETDPRLYGHKDVIEQSIIDLESEYLIYFGVER